MSGIAGCLALAGGTKPDADWTVRAIRRMAHRGPDDEGVFSDACNKAIEFDECNGGLIADNYIDNTRDGPQVTRDPRPVRDQEPVYRTTCGQVHPAHLQRPAGIPGGGRF